MPDDVMFNILDSHQDTRKIMLKWNAANKIKPSKTLLLSDSEVQQYTLSQFGTAFQHYSTPMNQTTETYAQIHHRMHDVLVQGSVTRHYIPSHHLGTLPC